MANLEKARLASLKTIICCSYCDKLFTKSGIKNHEKYCSSLKNCPVCGEKKVKLNNKTCSYSCSNVYFRSKPRKNAKNNYRTICFHFHDKKCVVCGEDKIVEVHHLDENNKNNDPSNLIPLCPTHHKYWHSRYKKKVEKIVLKYIRDWRSGNVCDLDSHVEGSIPSSLTK